MAGKGARVEVPTVYLKLHISLCEFNFLILYCLCYLSVFALLNMSCQVLVIKFPDIRTEIRS